MRLPCVPLISKACNGFPSNMNDNDSDTWALGCGATAIWNSNSVGAVISTSSSAPTSRFIVLMMRLSIWIREPSDGAGSDVGVGTYPIGRRLTRCRSFVGGHVADRQLP